MYFDVMIHLSTSPEATSADVPQTQPAPSVVQPSAPSPPSPPPNLQLATFNLQPSFQRFPGETPRAYSAFIAFFQLGHARSLQAVADKLGEGLGTVKNWSSKYDWTERLQSFNSGLLEQQAAATAAVHARQAADWAQRTSHYREQEWQAAQQLLGAVQCFLENLGDQQVEKMTLAQVSRAFQISSRIARLALSGTVGPDEPVLAPVHIELTAALKRAYGNPPADPGPPKPPAEAPATSSQPLTLN